ncbi:MAG: hypothetical protein HOK81_02465 [Rhodospirillaceae bacterium]|nr:hypothetical protein [Rhodospirillaceae bacterium]
MPVGAAASAALHGSVFGVVLLGWPILTVIVDDDWFSPDEYVRVDVVLYSEREDPEVAKGKGVVSFETETIGKGQAMAPGRTYGPIASRSPVALTKPNAVAKRKSAPDAPSKASETPKSETRSDARQEAVEEARAAKAETSAAKSPKSGAKSTESTAKDGDSQTSTPSAAGQRQSGEDQANGADKNAGLEGSNPTSAPQWERTDAETRPAKGQAAKGSETAKAEAARNETPASDRPKGQEDAVEGTATKGAEASRSDGQSPDPGESAERPRDGAETGRIEADTETSEADSDANGAAATGSQTAEAARQAENPPLGATEPATESNTEEPGQATAPETRKNDASADQATEPAKPASTRLSRVAAVLDLEPLSESAVGAPDETEPLPLTTAGEVIATRSGAAAPEDVPETAPEPQEALQASFDGERTANATPQLAQSGPSSRPSPIRNLPLRMVVEAMPGVDEKLVEAIDNPEAVPEQTATARRKKAIDRIAAAAERGYVHAQYGMARRYLMGQGVPRDPAAGAELLQQAAEQGHVPSQLLLGYLAARGYGRERSMADAMTWWTLAADAGDPNAASAAQIAEPTLDSEDLLAARRNVNSWRSVFGQVDETDSAGGDNTPQDTPLQEAVAAGDLPEVRSVLARGEDAEGRDIDGRTALINAGWRGDPNIAETLLEVGADPDIVDHEGKSALIWAGSNGNLSVTALLVGAGAELDIQDKQGLTALMRAAWNGHTKVVEALLRAGADTHLEDNNGQTALAHATREQYDDIIALLKGAAN